MNILINFFDETNKKLTFNLFKFYKNRQNYYRKDDRSMEFDVRIFINGVEVDPSDLPNYEIRNVAVDKIVNSVIDRTNSNREVTKLAS